MTKHSQITATSPNAYNPQRKIKLPSCRLIVDSLMSSLNSQIDRSPCCYESAQQKTCQEDPQVVLQSLAKEEGQNPLVKFDFKAYETKVLDRTISRKSKTIFKASQELRREVLKAQKLAEIGGPHGSSDFE